MTKKELKRKKSTMEELIKMGRVDEKLGNYLKEKVKTSSILFAGKNVSGKTTFMNALLECIGLDKSIMLIQDYPELFLQENNNIYNLRTFSFTERDRGDYCIKQQVMRQAVMGNVDYYILGDIQKDEAKCFFNACMTGHSVWTSICANDCLHALHRLVDYIKITSDYKLDNILTVLCKTIDVVVFLDDFKVTEVIELEGYDTKTKQILYKKV